MAEKRPLSEQLDEVIVWLDSWATFYHNRRIEAELAFRDAAQTLAAIRIFLFGEPGGGQK